MFAMRHHRYGGPEVLRLEEAGEPHAGPGQVRVAVRATGVTPADWYLRSGMLRDIAPLDFPHIPGRDAAGAVDEVGEGVVGTAVGDEVFGLVPFDDQGGAAAQYATLEAWAHTPRAWSFEEARGVALTGDPHRTAQLADAGRLTVPLHAVFPLPETPAAHEVSAAGHARGKIVITVP
ncbi:alcohol dehydrogenase catalytic domain-containing protein [Streptomyces sp. NPDC020607]|uniref:alcohol dehydrogenase catalytic domain-containing protein n=1 Tax=Streptomyces sp. NPDC020607 TaxID=3365082 RepID=UPI00379FF609